MKNKIKKIILGSVLVICLTGCGAGKYNNITVDDNEISLSDLVNEYKSNAVATSEKYITKTVSYTGKIESINSTNYAYLGGCPLYAGSDNKYYYINFVNDNINIKLYLKDSEININYYKAGDIITVNTNISEIYQNIKIKSPSPYILVLANYSGDDCEWGNTPSVITINK